MEVFKAELAHFLDRIGFVQTRTAFLTECQTKPVVVAEQDALAYLNGRLISKNSGIGQSPVIC
jgi:hypothetical protein